ncbi:cupredoxin domain-containing protein [Celerinatantimonas yamalensis]|uniref:Cupredoxin domain-containing protein n=2 Tax=Celerinatantimonas yamalensis TaxID=559956 RepID=A0ABW9G7G6_9GAMM
MLAGALFSSMIPLSYAQSIPEIKISVNDTQCDPMALSVTAGKVRFIIKNNSMRALEWEILKGVRVVAERENIAPGFYQKMTVDLEPGHYATTCGLLTNPRGSLVVNAAAGSQGYQVKRQDIIAIEAEYKYLLVTQTQALEAQVQAWQGSKVPADLVRQYAGMLVFARGFASDAADDKLVVAKVSRRALLAQVSLWKRRARENTLSLFKITQLLQQQLLASEPTSVAWHGLTADLTQFEKVLTPVMHKLDSKRLSALHLHIEQWRDIDSLAVRQQLHADLGKIATQLKLEKS